jgi:hypothetical protein
MPCFTIQTTNDLPAPRAARPRAWMWGLGTLWLTVVTGATFLMMGYANTPGKSGTAPTDWPTASTISRDGGQPTFVMFMHPHCPCSRASVEELSRLMAHCQGRVDAHVFFLRPAGMDLDWVHSDSWASASHIPGVVVHCDDNGKEARIFGAETSGDTELFDAAGRLIFHGGITAARGHAGDNDGLASVQAFVLHQTATASSHPVFGCSLFECSATNTP